MSVLRHHREDKWTMMHRAINKGCLNEIDELIDNGFDLNERFPLSGNYHCETAIGCCAVHGTVKTMYHLISHGADYKVLSDLHGRKCNILEMAIRVDNFLVAEQLYFSELEYYDDDNHCIRRMDLEPFEKNPEIIFRPMSEKYIKKAIDENVMSEKNIFGSYVSRLIRQGIDKNTLQKLIKINPRFSCLEIINSRDIDTLKMLIDMGLDIGFTFQTARILPHPNDIAYILRSGIRLKGSSFLPIDFSRSGLTKDLFTRLIEIFIKYNVKGFTKENTQALLGHAIKIIFPFSKEQLEYLIDSTDDSIFDSDFVSVFQDAIDVRIRNAAFPFSRAPGIIRNIWVFRILDQIYEMITTLEELYTHKNVRPIKIAYAECFMKFPYYIKTYENLPDLMHQLHQPSEEVPSPEQIDRISMVKFFLLAFGGKLLRADCLREYDLKLTPSDYHRLPPSVLKVITAMTLLNKTEGNVVNLLPNELLFEIFSWLVPF